MKGNETVGLTLLHVRFAERLPGDVMRTVLSGLPGSLRRAQGRGHRDGAELRRRRARRVRRRRAAHRAGLRARRPLAPRVTGPHAILGLGTDLVEVERFRLALAAPGDPRATASSATPSAPTRAQQHDPAKPLAARFAAKEAVMKALGVGSRELRAARRRGGARRRRGDAVAGAARVAPRSSHASGASPGGTSRSRTPTRPRWRS